MFLFGRGARQLNHFAGKATVLAREVKGWNYTGIISVRSQSLIKTVLGLLKSHALISET